MTNSAETGQLSRSAADVYEEFFVPALFGEWAGPMCDAVRITEGNKVLDVACGTGVLTREAASRALPGGAVIGVDCNEAMLAVAGRISQDGNIEWRPGRAEALPFEDESFDAVVCQFGLMFFEDRIAALKEMWRVARPGGRLAVAVWDKLDNTPGYAAMVGLLYRLFGDAVANALRAPFTLGDTDDLAEQFRDAGIANARIESRIGQARFPSIESWVHTDVKGWTLADMIDDAQYEILRQAAQGEMQQFVRSDGSVRFASPAHIVTAAKP